MRPSLIAALAGLLLYAAPASADPTAALSPAVADVAAGQTFTLRNTGNEALEVGPARFSGPGFVLGADGCSGAAVAPGTACTGSLRRRARPSAFA